MTTHHGKIMSEIIIRDVEIEDAKDLVEIYRPYVEKTAITFEYDCPSLEEFTNRIQTIIKKYPYIVAIKDNVIIGYAYANTFKGRKAYDYSVETSIYIKDDFHKSGVGKKLYEVLEKKLVDSGITNMYACITQSDVETPYMTNGSILFHEKMGFKLCGKFTKCGYKFDTWFNMIWMEKFINEHTKK